MEPTVLSRHIKSNTLPSLEYSCDSNQFDDNKLCIGFITKQAINRLHEDGSISDTIFKKKIKGARKFLVEAVTYLLNGVHLKKSCWCMLPGLILKKGYKHFLFGRIFCTQISKYIGGNEYG